MIKITNLNRVVKDNYILTDINLTFKAGEKVAIVGGNGAGKTSLIETIIGIAAKSSGTVEFDYKFQKSPLEIVGVQFQDSNFPPGLKVNEIINFFLAKALHKNEALVKKLIKAFKIDDFLDFDGSKISGGQAQKVNVLLALLNKPKIIILDELTTGLDVFAQSTIVDEVEKYINKEKATMLLVSHNATEIERLATRVVLLDKGKVTFDGKVTDIIKKHKSVANFLKKLI